MRLLNTAIVRLTLILLAGIYTGFQFSPPLDLLYLFFAGALIFFTFSYNRSRNLLLQDHLFGISCLILFFILGIGTAQFHKPVYQSSHYSNLLESENPIIIATISERLKPDLYQNKYVAEVRSISNKKTSGKLLLLLPLDLDSLQVDDFLAIASPLIPIPTSLNPQQFNYRRFMENRGILYQTNPLAKEVFPLGQKQQTLSGMAGKLQERIQMKLKQQKIAERELLVIQALLLGQRRDIPKEVHENFVAAGAVHILAVSGLHVGIILLILNFLLSPIDRLPSGKLIKTVLLLAFLWGFALLAGLSPSVVRAVSMFSFVAVGIQLRRQTSIFNTLFLSLLLLVLLRPQWIFEVGFQLSYLAVFSIVLLQPRLAALFNPKHKILQYFWSIFTVTLAAQIGVFPIGLYYFHQFPGLFFLSNLIILPFLGVILSLGISVIVLALLNKLPTMLADTLEILIQLLNDLVVWIAEQENFVLQDIPFSLLQLFLFYSFLLALILLKKASGNQKLKLLLMSLICFQISSIYEIAKDRSRELVIFHKVRHTVIGEKFQRNLIISHNLVESFENQQFLKNYQLTKRISLLQNGEVQNIYSQGDGLLLVIDSLSVYEVPHLNPKQVLLTNSPKINLERMIMQLGPKEIIADGSNYSSIVKQWQITCGKYNIPLHHTGVNGAYIKKLVFPEEVRPKIFR